MQQAKTIFAIFLCSTLSCGCGRKEQTVVPVGPRSDQVAETDPQSLEFFPLAQLTPDRPTHLAADSLGDVYWIQETPSGEDTLFVAGQDDIPHPTGLTTAAILAACAPSLPTATPAVSPATSPGTSSGNIQSIAVDADDRVVFFFNGGIGRSTCVCLGQFDPHDQSIHILASTASLASQSGMEGSIALALGQILKPLSTDAGGHPQYWLWLHHSDAAALMQFDPAIESGNTGAVSRAVARYSLDGADQDLKDDQLDLAAGENISLLMTNWRTAWLYRLDENRVATQWLSVLGLPRNLSALTPRPGGVAIAFAPVGEPAAGSDGDGQSVKDAHLLKVNYPALIAFTPNGVVAIAARDDMTGPSQLDIGKLRLQQILPTSKAREWVGYDAESGLVLRVRMRR